MIDNSGKVIYLNGTSSAGKTTLTEALLDALQEPYFNFSINNFEQFVSRKQIQRGIVPDIEHLDLGFIRCIEALAISGNNLIVDDVIAPSMDLLSGRADFARAMLHRRTYASPSGHSLPFRLCSPSSKAGEGVPRGGDPHWRLRQSRLGRSGSWVADLGLSCGRRPCDKGQIHQKYDRCD